MNETAPSAEEKVYRAIGRFICEFSQVEYTIRHYLAEEIGLKEEHFTPVVESYDVAALCTVAKKIFAKSRACEIAAGRQKGINRFFELNNDRNPVTHGLWVPFTDGVIGHPVPRDLNRVRLKHEAGEQ